MPISSNLPTTCSRCTWEEAIDTRYVLENASASRAIGHTNNVIEDFALFGFSDIHIDGQTRWQKFARTVRGFAAGGSRVGAVGGLAAMWLPDCFIGTGKRGVPLREINRRLLREQGVAGASVRGASMLAAVLTAQPSLFVGGAAGVVSLPVAANQGNAATEWVIDTTRSVAAFNAKTVGTVIAAPAGAAIGIARSASVVAKLTMASIGGLLGGIIGILGGGVRAIINR